MGYFGAFCHQSHRSVRTRNNMEAKSVFVVIISSLMFPSNVRAFFPITLTDVGNNVIFNSTTAGSGIAGLTLVAALGLGAISGLLINSLFFSLFRGTNTGFGEKDYEDYDNYYVKRSVPDLWDLDDLAAGIDLQDSSTVENCVEKYFCVQSAINSTDPRPKLVVRKEIKEAIELAQQLGAETMDVEECNATFPCPFDMESNVKFQQILQKYQTLLVFFLFNCHRITAFP